MPYIKQLKDSHNMQNKTVKLYVESLGCPKNSVDSELMIGYLKKIDKNLIVIDSIEEADTALINTCGFITPAKEESIDAIMEAIEVKKRRKDMKIVVAGCLYERYKQELKEQIPEVDNFIGVYELNNITKAVFNEEMRCKKPYLSREPIVSPPHIGYLKIAEGCSNGCSFCAIPLIKGGFKSRDTDELIEEAYMLAEKGKKELYIIAQDTTAYMFDKQKQDALTELLSRLEHIKGLEWIRLMYTYPSFINKKLIDTIASSNKIVNYIDVPIQHISDNVLKSMNRKYTKNDIIGLIEKLKQQDIAIRSTFIVGYPNETEDDFEQLCDFIEEYELDWVGFFQYYHEENTQSFKLKDLPNDIKQQRLIQIETIQREVYAKKHQQLIHKNFEAIIDKPSNELPGFFEARLKRSAYEIDGIVFAEGKDIKIGDIVEVEIDNVFNDTDLIGIIKT